MSRRFVLLTEAQHLHAALGVDYLDESSCGFVEGDQAREGAELAAVRRVHDATVSAFDAAPKVPSGGVVLVLTRAEAEALSVALDNSLNDPDDAEALYAGRGVRFRAAYRASEKLFTAMRRRLP